ncbi:MAG: site-specific integrase [Cocleimonas sp.]
MKQDNISKLRSQAASALKWQRAFSSSRGASKRSDSTSSGIHSVRTWNENVCALAKIANDMGVNRLKQITTEKAIDYLIQRVSSKLSDKTVSRDRVAIERFLSRKMPSYQDLQAMDHNPHIKGRWLKGIKDFIKVHAGDPRSPLGNRSKTNRSTNKAGVGAKKSNSSRVGSTKQLKETSRAYSDDQVKAIAMSFEKERERLAILLMRDAGLRVHEMYSLRRVNEGKPVTAQRDWRADRHLHRSEGVKYIVTGKGGLTREIVISKGLADRLEKLRNEKPIKVKDRGVNYRQRYNLLAGNSLSKAFTRSSKRELGFSTGAHGFRHSYAQSRMSVLLSNGLSAKNAKHIVSQELGHMRASITNTYLR